MQHKHRGRSSGMAGPFSKSGSMAMQGRGFLPPRIAIGRQTLPNCVLRLTGFDLENLSRGRTQLDVCRHFAGCNHAPQNN
jgi:hypothetical protein